MRIPTQLRERLRTVTAAEPTDEAFLSKPYASVQLLLLAAVGLLGFGILMAVSTTIAASHDDSGGTGSIWAQMVKEVEFIAIGLPLFWFAMRMSPRMLRVLVYPMLC